MCKPQHLFLCFSICFACCITVWAQKTDTSFRLLWFKGKKINDSTIVTKSQEKVIFSPAAGEIQVSIPTGSDHFSRLRNEVKRTNQRKSEITQSILKKKGGQSKVALIVQINQGMDRAAETARGAIGNKMKLLNRSGPLQDGLYRVEPGGDLAVRINNYYNAVMKYVAGLQSEQAFNTPEPPSSGMDYCFPCDSARQQKYRMECQEFIKQFSNEEQYHLYLAVQVMNYYETQKIKHVRYDSFAAITRQPDMGDAINAIRHHLETKLVSVWAKYREDATKLSFLMELMLSHVHTNEVMGIESIAEFPALDSMARQMITTAKKFSQKALSERDYPVILDIRVIVQLMRLAEILSLEDYSTFNQAIMEYEQNNRFIIAVDTEAKIGNEGGYGDAVMNGENIFQAAPDSNCVLKWTFIESDEKSYMQYNLQKAEVHSTGGDGIFRGPYKWKTSPAYLALDFCKDEKDTALFYNFSPLEGAETWTMPEGTAAMPMIPGLFMAAFIDEERLREVAAKYQNPENLAKLKKEQEERMEQMMKAYQETAKKDPSKMTPEEIKQLQKFLSAKQNVRAALPADFAISTYLVRDHLQNKLKTVFEKTLNGKELNPGKEAILVADFKVRIIHVEKGDKEY